MRVRAPKPSELQVASDLRPGLRCRACGRPVASAEYKRPEPGQELASVTYEHRCLCGLSPASPCTVFAEPATLLAWYGEETVNA